MKIQALKVDQVVASVGGTAEVHEVLVAGGVWFQKRWRTAVFASGTFAGEAIGHLLAQALNVPTPGFAVVAGDPQAWLSEGSEAPWAPSGSVAELEQLGRILMVDAILHNDDRHPGNLGRLRGSVVAFDFDKTPLGVPQLAPGYLKKLRVQKIPPQTLERVHIDPVVAGARAIAAAASALPEPVIHSIVETAVAGSPEPKSDAAEIAPTLVARCRTASALFEILERNLRGGVDGWTQRQ